MSQCKHFRVRSEKYQKYFYCLKLKKKIDVKKCSTCEYKDYKTQKKWKNKSKKLNKLERKRTSILTNDKEHCFLCNRKIEQVNRHEIFFGRNRKQSMEYGLVVYLCDDCHTISDLSVHNNYFTDLKLKQIGQVAFEKQHSHEEFMKIFGKNYL